MAADLCCPECGAKTISVADGYDPFAPEMRSAAVMLDCPAGHRWIEGYGRDGEPGQRSKMLCVPKEAP